MAKAITGRYLPVDGKKSTGKLKKIYAALYQAKKENINAMVKVLVELLPQGIKTMNLDIKSARN